MQDLIIDLLAFSRVGRTTEGFEPVDLRQCVETATHNLASMVAETAASVEIDGDLAIVDGDRGLLTAVFQNLIGNAIKFRSDKPPRIVVAATQTDGEATMCVEDNGIGIEQRFADRIFVIFQRLHGREAYAGTGIGLALSRKIVEFHGGRIWLDTERVEGARFCFTLPVTAKETRDEPDEQRQSDRDPARRG
jgi:light-regulated signal transduction histidine kinase (bacteriophytochrome)